MCPQASHSQPERAGVSGACGADVGVRKHGRASAKAATAALLPPPWAPSGSHRMLTSPPAAPRRRSHLWLCPGGPVLCNPAGAGKERCARSPCSHLAPRREVRPAAPIPDLLGRLQMGGSSGLPAGSQALSPHPSHPTVPHRKGARLPFDSKHLHTKGRDHPEPPRLSSLRRTDNCSGRAPPSAPGWLLPSLQIRSVWLAASATQK